MENFSNQSQDPQKSALWVEPIRNEVPTAAARETAVTQRGLLGWVIRVSGGRVKNDQQAHFVLVVVLLVLVILVFLNLRGTYSATVPATGEAPTDIPNVRLDPNYSPSP